MSRKRTVELIVTAVLVTAATVAAASETITYSYDAKGRLILVTHTGTVNNNVVANYTFDAADNRKNIKVTGAP
jgi:YD repeat-containing protein